jgi:hypothetical protein
MGAGQPLHECIRPGPATNPQRLCGGELHGVECIRSGLLIRSGVGGEYIRYFSGGISLAG